jgi:hypothetical protein
LFGLLWGLAYLGSILPHLYFRSGIIDPWFNLFIFLSLYLFFTRASYIKGALYAGIFCGLAILTKGPVALLILSLVVVSYWIVSAFKKGPGIFPSLMALLVSLLVAGVWFAMEYINNGGNFVKLFTIYQLHLLSTEGAGHGGFPGYHVVILLIGCFPASVFAIKSFLGQPTRVKSQVEIEFTVLMKILFWVVLILFSIVQSKIVHYSSLAYFPITFLAAGVVLDIVEGRTLFKGWLKVIFISIGFLIGIFVLCIPLLGRNIEILQQAFKDDLVVSSILDLPVSWPFETFVPGIILLATLVSVILFVKRNQILRGMYLLFIGTALFVFFGLSFFIGRAEAYIQRSAVDYYKSIAGQDVYVSTFGFKSYAQYYYTKIEKSSIPPGKNVQWLLDGAIDKPAYILTKLDKLHKLKSYTDLTELGRKGGFVFLVRESANE